MLRCRVSDCRCQQVALHPYLLQVHLLLVPLQRVELLSQLQQLLQLPLPQLHRLLLDLLVQRSELVLRLLLGLTAHIDSQGVSLIKLFVFQNSLV